MVATGRSPATKAVAAVICPLFENVIPETVAPVTLFDRDKTPDPLTLNPVPTETPPTALLVAKGRSLAPRATVERISPWALNVIPERVPAVITLLIPRFPDATFNERSRLEVFNFAGVIVASLIFVAPSKPVFS